MTQSEPLTIVEAMKALIVEDNRQQAEFTRAGLSDFGLESRIVEDGQSGLEALLNEEYAIDLVDIRLPGIDGFSLIRTAREAGCQIPIIVLSVQGEIDAKVKGLDAGADDYLAKPFSFDELRARIDAVRRRFSPSMGHSILTADTLEMDVTTHKVRRAGRKITLPNHEYLLLEYFLRHRGRIVSKKMILEDVWDYADSIKSHVVEMAVSALRKEINGPNDLKLIRTIRKFGYVLD